MEKVESLEALKREVCGSLKNQKVIERICVGAFDPTFEPFIGSGFDYAKKILTRVFEKMEDRQ